MKKYLLSSLKLTAALILLLAVIYPMLIAGIAKLAPGGGDGVKIYKDGKAVGYENIAQAFTSDRYFQPRPSAVSYNAAGSGGSNKGPANPEYLKQVQDRVDTFLAHNPGVQKKEIPAELVTASGSGLDPDISPAAAMVQVKRVASLRGMEEAKLKELVAQHTEHRLLGFLGPEKINVLKLNIALDELK
ncbi:K(+)-transporting ATPase subunit C [Chitinophagaceae bacterium MMS25-I14]